MRGPHLPTYNGPCSQGYAFASSSPSSVKASAASKERWDKSSCARSKRCSVSFSWSCLVTKEFRTQTCLTKLGANDGMLCLLHLFSSKWNSSSFLRFSSTQRLDILFENQKLWVLKPWVFTRRNRPNLPYWSMVSTCQYLWFFIPGTLSASCASLEALSSCNSLDPQWLVVTATNTTKISIGYASSTSNFS